MDVDTLADSPPAVSPADSPSAVVGFAVGVSPSDSSPAASPAVVGVDGNVASPSDSSPAASPAASPAVVGVDGNVASRSFLSRSHVQKDMLRSYLGLFSLDLLDDSDDEDSSEGEFAEVQGSWVADFVMAFSRCGAVQRDRFVHDWAEPLLQGNFPALCRNISSMIECEWISDEIRAGAFELLDLLVEVVQPMWESLPGER